MTIPIETYWVWPWGFGKKKLGLSNVPRCLIERNFDHMVVGGCSRVEGRDEKLLMPYTTK
jgi:hypothetical protein